MKIVNITNKTFNQRMLIDTFFIALYNVVIISLCIYIIGWFAIPIALLFIIFDVFAYKFLKGHYELPDNDSDREIKHIVLNKKEIKVYKNKNCEKYDINELQSLSLDIETCTYGVGIVYGGCGYFRGCKNMYVTFLMKNGTSFKIITHKSTLSEDIHMIYKMIDCLPEEASFGYSFSGEGVAEEIEEKINYYREHKVKLLNTKEDRKELKQLAILFFFGGLALTLFFIISTWQFIIEDINCLWVFIKLFLIFCLISGLIYSPVIIDNIKIKR